RLRWQRLDLGDPAGGLDLGAGRGGEGMSDHGDLAVPVAVTEDLDRLARRFDQASLDQTLQRDRLIALDFRQLLQVDGDVFRAEDIHEAALVGQALDQRQLAALETRIDIPAGAGLLALGAAAGRLDTAAAMAAA